MKTVGHLYRPIWYQPVNQQLIQNIVGPELLVSHTPLNNLFHGGGLTKQPHGITLMTLHDA